MQHLIYDKICKLNFQLARVIYASKGSSDFKLWMVSWENVLADITIYDCNSEHIAFCVSTNRHEITISNHIKSEDIAFCVCIYQQKANQFFLVCSWEWPLGNLLGNNVSLVGTRGPDGILLCFACFSFSKFYFVFFAMYSININTIMAPGQFVG